MVAVIVCSLFNLATLVGLLAGIVCGIWQARAAVGAALTWSPEPGAADGVRRRAAVRLWLA